MKTLSSHGSFGGTQGFFAAASADTGTEMRFSAFVPAGAGPFPCLIWLSGLTATEANFPEKAGAQRVAAELGVVVVAPDTSPRGDRVPDDDASDLGQGASFYLDATEAPWAEHFRMESFLSNGLPALLRERFPVDRDRFGIFGHSMGGHGALILALKHPELFKTCSAFAPIAAPSQCPWGRKALAAYLGDDAAAWREHDASALIEDGKRLDALLVDQGLDDPFLEDQLMPAALEAACAQKGLPLELRRHAGYDHSYYFIASFIEDHLRWHVARLG